MKKQWHKLDERSVFKNPVVHVTEKDFHYDAVNDSMPFTVVKMNNWSLIVPVTADNEFIAVRQFRAGPEDDTLEFPGGSIDAGETPAQAAARELEEETGAVAESIIPLGIMDPNPAFMSNKCNVFLAKNAKITKQPNLDKFEDTQAVIIPYDEMICMIKNGEFRQSLSVAAFGLYLVNGKRE